MAIEVQYDGDCPLCRDLVAFAASHLAQGEKISFVPRSGTICTVDGKCAESVIAIVDGVRHEKSDAVVEVMKHLRWPWRAGAAMKILPRVVRDHGYDLVARNRHKLRRSSQQP